MSTASIIMLGAIAGLTIFLGLPVGRMRNASAALKVFLNATATGVLLFLFWDVLTAGDGQRRAAAHRGAGRPRRPGARSPATPPCSPGVWSSG